MIICCIFNHLQAMLTQLHYQIILLSITYGCKFKYISILTIYELMESILNTYMKINKVAV